MSRAPMPKPETIKIVNWEKFQHYKRRNPPWIRLYRDVMDSDEWRSLPDAAKALLPELWLMASEGHPGGSLSAELEGIAWKTGRPISSCQDLLYPLAVLAEASFIKLPASMTASILAITDASPIALIPASTAVSQSQRTETETETETTLDQPKKRDPKNLYVDVEEFRLFGNDFGVDPAKIEEILGQ